MSIPTCLKWYLPYWFSHQNVGATSYLSHACHMSHPLFILNLINRIILVRNMDTKFLIYSLRLPVAFLSLLVLTLYLFSDTLHWVCCSFWARGQLHARIQHHT
jgi:hypothetical protein